MWRFQSVHERGETEYLDEAIKRLELDDSLLARADAQLQAACAQEPIIQASLTTPQDHVHHAEGPFLDAHLRRMLVVLYAIVEEKLHLIDIEEFRRMKGYEGEIDELEEMMKEKLAFFETFILVHDVAKGHAITFSCPSDSRGARYGLVSQTLTDPVVDEAQRQNLLEQYRQLFQRFRADHPTLGDREAQKAFCESLEIRLNYPHHDRMMYAPVQHDLLKRVAEAHELSDRDASMLCEIVARHLEFEAFHRVNISMVHWLLHLARAHEYDGDDFLDIVDGCIFLDWVCGSMRTTPNGTTHEVGYLLNVLIAEHQLMPERRLEAYQQRERKQQALRHRYFQEAGLDGTALMQLLQMKPGPQFGKTLRHIQEAILGEGEMPELGPAVTKELEERSLMFYRKMFVKGD